MSEQVAILQSLQPVLSTLVEAGVAACDGVLAQAWLVGPGDLCDACPMRPECPNQSSCLHLVASAGAGGDAVDLLRRHPIGSSSLGRIPVSHAPLVARSGLDALGMAEPAWLAGNKVRALAALPLEHGERCIGVLAVFSRGALPEAQLRVLATSTRLGAEAVGNVAAFRTLAADRNRLAAKNARLRSGLGLAPEPEPARAAPEPTQPPPIPVTYPPPPAPPPPPEQFPRTGVMPHADAAIPLPLRSFAEVQREGILRTLERTNWRVSGPKGAAAVLRLKPTTLESKMKKLGIHRPPR
jgi:transcriptional regulator with GAF, ATPase, and Fis domain